MTSQCINIPDPIVYQQNSPGGKPLDCCMLFMQQTTHTVAFKDLDDLHVYY